MTQRKMKPRSSTSHHMTCDLDTCKWLRHPLPVLETAVVFVIELYLSVMTSSSRMLVAVLNCDIIIPGSVRFSSGAVVTLLRCLSHVHVISTEFF